MPPERSVPQALEEEDRSCVYPGETPPEEHNVDQLRGAASGRTAATMRVHDGEEEETDGDSVRSKWERLCRCLHPPDHTAQVPATTEDSSEEDAETGAAAAAAAARSSLQQRNHWVALLFGQCIALVAASMNATSYTLVQKYELKTQLFQLFFIYSLLTLHLIFGLRWPSDAVRSRSATSSSNNSDGAPSSFRDVVPPRPRRSERNDDSEHNDDTVPDNSESSIETEEEATSHPFPFFPRIRLRIPWHYYLCMSLLDVIPNFLSLYSFRYTSLTSTTLLSSLTIPSTMFFSWQILRKVFSCHHYVGVFLCVLGGAFTVYMDAVGDEDSDGAEDAKQQDAYIGDLLAIVSAVMYGLGDCLAEYSVKRIDRNEYLGMLGFFGALITGATFPWLEHDALKELFQIPTLAEKLEVAGLMVLFVLIVVLYYVLEARFLVSSDATLLNLSMQSVNLWVFFFTFAVYRSNAPPSTFFLAILFVVSGVFLYEMGFCRCRNEDGRCHKRSRSSSEVEIVQDQMPAISYHSVVREGSP